MAASVSADVLRVLLNLASWLGIIVGVVAFSGNGLIWHFFDNSSASSVKQLNMNKLRALALKMDHNLEMARVKMQASKTFAQIQEALPEYTDASASRSRDGYLRSRFAAVDKNNDGVLTFDEIEQAALAMPEPQREYSRADRNERLSVAATTRPASAVVAPTDPDGFTVDANGRSSQSNGSNFPLS